MCVCTCIYLYQTWISISVIVKLLVSKRYFVQVNDRRKSDMDQENWNCAHLLSLYVN